MSPSASSPSGPAELLLAQLGWVQALARQLCADPEVAEDVAQETCVTALEERPSDASKLRAWLAQVLRNRLRARARADGRRRAREEASAGLGASTSTDELVARASAQRAVVAAVLELDEPYRSTVLLRWFRELRPRDVARAQGVPVETVHSRLKRAHARLRRRLDADFGQRSSWSVLFVPPALAHGAGSAAGAAAEGLALAAADGVAGVSLAGLAAPTLGTFLMKLSLAVVAALVAAGATIYWIAAPSDAPALASPGVALEAAGLERAPAEAVRPSALAAGPAEPRAAQRTEVEPAPSAPEEPRPPSAAPAVHTIAGRLLGGDGQPLAGLAIAPLRLALQDPAGAPPAERSLPERAASARSDAGGNFRLDVTDEQATLVVREPGWVTVRQGVWRKSAAVEPVIVAAPALELSGRVRDESGAAIPDAFVSYRMPAGFASRFPLVLEGSREGSWTTHAGADGAFAMSAVPAIDGATLMASRDGYLPARVALPRFAAHGLEIVLARPSAPLAGTLRGRVVDDAGRGIEGARVALGLTSVLTGADGGFAIDLARAVTSERLSAIRQGFQPAVAERPEEPRALDDGTRTSGWPDFVVLALVAPSRTLGGLVVDHEGRPRAGVKVWVDDPTPFAPIGMIPATAEGFAAGAPIPREALESEAGVPDEDGDSFWDWRTSNDGASMLWSWVETDGDGRFALPGLCDRAYTLCALPEGELGITRTAPIEAGRADAVIRLDEPERRARVAGRVVTERGVPVAGARLSLWLPVVERRARIRGGRSEVILTRPGPRARTDAEGRFELADVTAEHLCIDIGGEDVVPATIELDDAGDLDALELVVSVRCHLQVELTGDPERADAVGVASEDGTRLDVLVITLESVNAYDVVPLAAGRSGVFSTSSRARLLRLFKDGELVEEHPVDLLPGRVNELSF